MFVPRHVNRQLSPPRQCPWTIVSTLLIVVSASTSSFCQTIRATPPPPVEDIIIVQQQQTTAVDLGHKSTPLLKPLTNNGDSATTPPSRLADRLATEDYPQQQQQQLLNRVRRSARPLNGGELEFYGLNPYLTSLAADSMGLADLRKYLNSDCVQYEHRHLGDGRPTPGGTVVKSVPCNHRKKYLDGQWEDTLFAEEPGYIVVRREIEQKPLVASVADLENNEEQSSMEFIPIRGRKKKWLAGGWPPFFGRLDPQTAAAEAEAAAATIDDVFQLQSKRDSRQTSSRNSLSEPDAGGDSRGKKGRIDQILAKEDFMPNRGKRFLLRHLNYLRHSLSYPKRGKKTRHTSNSPAKDLMWLTKDSFYPHRGKKTLENVVNHPDEFLITPSDIVEDELENVSPLQNGVIFGGGINGARDGSSMGRQNREELLNNLSKQEAMAANNKWRGWKRSGHNDSYDEGELQQRRRLMAALNQNNEEEVNSIDDDASASAAFALEQPEDQRAKPGQ